MIRNIFRLLLILSVLVACGGKTTDRIVSEVDSLATANPQKALLLIDSIEKSNDLSESQRMSIAWNRSIAHKALGMSLAEDSLLPEAIAHYRSRNENTDECYIMEASYLYWTGQTDKALKVMDDGLAAAKDTAGIMQLLMMKAEIYGRQNKHNLAIESLEKALKVCKSKREEAILNYRLGLRMSLTGDRRSEQYYDKGICLALECGDTAVACEFMRNYADYLSNNGQYRRSNDLLYRLCGLMPRLAGMSAIQMSMAANYINLRRTDSARICNTKAVESERGLEAQGYANLTRRAVLEQQRFLLDYESGKAVSGTDFARFCDSVTNDMIMKENTSTRRLETKNRLLSANYELQLGKTRLAWALTVALLLIAIGIVAAYHYHKNKFHRLAEAEDRIDTLTRMLEEAVAENASRTSGEPAEDNGTDEDALFKKTLLQQLGIIRMMAGTPTEQNQALLKRISAIGGGEIPTGSLLVWDDLYPVIDRLYDNFHARLTAKYGNVLSEKEIQICCLLCAGFTTKEIGVITQQTNATIYVRKTSIRKKIGVGEGQDIVEFVRNN